MKDSDVVFFIPNIIGYLRSEFMELTTNIPLFCFPL